MAESKKALFTAADGIYLLNHSVGRPPVSTMKAWNEGFLAPWEQAGEDTWSHWLQAMDRFRNALSVLLNSSAANFCPQTNLSAALTKIITCLRPDSTRRTLLYTEHDFPSMGFVLQQATRQGYRLRALPENADSLDPKVWTDYLTDDVAAVLVTHVHSNTGRQVPVVEISAAAAQRNIVCIVDIAQSAGVVPIDLSQWRADFVIGSSVKWLCGGPGAGFLWASNEQIAISEPADVGWFSHENPFEFDINNFRYARDALRFWGGTPSVAPFVVATNSIEQMCAIGIESIRAHNLALTDQIILAVDRQNIVTPTEPFQRGGTLVLRFEQSRQNRISDRLRAAKIAFDERPSGIRLSPHIYNDESEIEILTKLL